MIDELPNVKKWVVLYPTYINSMKTMAEGRRLCLTKACENPTCGEIGDCCAHLNLPFVIEVCISTVKLWGFSLHFLCRISLNFHNSSMGFLSRRLTRRTRKISCKEGGSECCWRERMGLCLTLRFLRVRISLQGFPYCFSLIIRRFVSL